MIPETETNSKPSIGSLLGGIVSDVKDLFAQELKLARKEISEDIQKTRTALTALGVGLVVLAISLGLLVLMLVHLIDALTNIPLWGCYGIVGVGVGIIGVIFLIMGKNRVQDVDFTPEAAAKAVKEDMGWIRARVISNRIVKEHEPLSLRR
jgi:uncharacterized membrane protein YqjE